MFFLVKHFDARKPTQALVSILEKVPLKKNNIRERSRSEQILEEIYIISDQCRQPLKPREPVQ